MAPTPTIIALEDVKTVGAGLASAMLTAFLAWFKLRRMTANDNKEITADNATTAVIEMLRTEIQRLADQNTKLATLVNDLQLQVVDLHARNAELREDVARISNERYPG